MLFRSVMVLGYCELRVASGHFLQSQGGRLSVVRREDQFMEGSRVKDGKERSPITSFRSLGQITPKSRSIFGLFRYICQ